MYESLHGRGTFLLRIAPLTLLLGVLYCGGLIFALLESLGAAGYSDTSWTLDYYLELAGDREIRLSLLLTFGVAVATAVLSSAAGLGLALGLRSIAARPWAAALAQLPVAVPHLAMALAALTFLAPSGLVARAMHWAGLLATPAEFPVLLQDGYGIGIVLVYIAKEAPFLALVCLAVLLGSEDYESVASTLGANRWQRLRHVTLPLLAPALGGGAIVVFGFVFGAFEVPYLVGRPFPAMAGVVAQRRFMSTELSDRPGAVALALLIAALATLVVWSSVRIGERYGARR